ncbi:MAG: nucleotidyltransferase domain-containing protein [Ignisphaera sp.]
MDAQTPAGFVREVHYDRRRWNVFMEKRRKALKILLDLKSCGILEAFAHGSIARGDVDEDSDVDISLLNSYPSSILRYCLERNGYNVYSLSILQATPKHTPKIYIYLNALEELCISNPLARLDPIEMEYYRFSGMVDLNDIMANIRVVGVNKRLMFIEPTEFGHREFPVIGNEGYVAKRLGISLGTVIDRVEALSKRIEDGHTGLFIKIELPDFEHLEPTIEKLCIENSLFRRRVIKHGLCI